MYHNDFDAFERKSGIIKATGWSIVSSADFLKISMDDPAYILPKFEIHVDRSLRFSVRVFGWLLPDNRNVYIPEKCYNSYLNPFDPSSY